MQPLVDILARHALRTTQPRRRVFETLSQAKEPLTTTQLIALASDVDKVSVYRTIELFTKLGIVTAVTHKWKRRYELASPLKPHHHHLFCTACGHHIEIHSKHLEQLITTISKEHGFTAHDHHFEVSGICDDCHSL